MAKARTRYPLLPEGCGDSVDDKNAPHSLVGGEDEGIVEGIFVDILPPATKGPLQSDLKKEEEEVSDFLDLFGSNSEDTGEKPNDKNQGDVQPTPSRSRRWPMFVIIGIGVLGAFWYTFGDELKFAKFPIAAQNPLHHDDLDAILFALGGGTDGIPWSTLKAEGNALISLRVQDHEVGLRIQIAEGSLPDIPSEPEQIGDNVVLKFKVPGLKGKGVHGVAASRAPVHAIAWNETEVEVLLVSSDFHYSVAKDGKVVAIRFWFK